MLIVFSPFHGVVHVWHMHVSNGMAHTGCTVLNPVIYNTIQIYTILTDIYNTIRIHTTIGAPIIEVLSRCRLVYDAWCVGKSACRDLH